MLSGNGGGMERTMNNMNQMFAIVDIIMLAAGLYLMYAWYLLHFKNVADSYVHCHYLPLNCNESKRARNRTRQNYHKEKWRDIFGYNIIHRLTAEF